MRFIFALALACACLARAEMFVFSRDGTNIVSAPRELPSVGTRLKDGAPVVGLHAASPAVRAACGWYLCSDTNVVPAGMMLSNSVWRIKGTAAVRECAYRPVTVRPKVDGMQRLREALKGLTDEQVGAIVKEALAR